MSLGIYIKKVIVEQLKLEFLVACHISIFTCHALEMFCVGWFYDDTISSRENVEKEFPFKPNLENKPRVKSVCEFNR